MGRHGNSQANTKTLTYFRRLNQTVLLSAALIPLLLFTWNWRHVSLVDSAASRPLAREAPNGNSGLSSTKTALDSPRLFPFSVIAGGARSRLELKNALANDPVAAAHYAGFDVARTHVIRLDRTRAMYVSYRVDNHIYWTSKRLDVPGGETLLTDGENAARTRCGNRLSETPQLPVSAKEPSRTVLGGPALPAEAVPVHAFAKRDLARPVPSFPEFAGPDPNRERSLVPPLIPILGGPGAPPGSPTNDPPTSDPPGVPGQPLDPPAPTPEPSGLLLVSAGLFALWALRRKLRA